MKLKCIDGKVRDFALPEKSVFALGNYIDAHCKKCGKNFGVHDTHILKPEFKKHICKEESK